MHIPYLVRVRTHQLWQQSKNKQYSLLDTRVDDILFFGLQEHIYKQFQKFSDMSTGFADRHIVGHIDLSIDVFQEGQNKRYS